MIDRIDPLGLLALMPRVKRARAFRLYLESGKRLVDLWQYGGAAALGHTPPRVLLAFKDTASRGLFCTFPSIHDRHFGQVLSRLIPSRSAVRWYSSPAAADRALAVSGLGVSSLSAFHDPAFAPIPADARASIWRPWLPELSDSTLPAVLCPVVPLPHPARPIAFLLDPEIAERFPASEPSSPVVLAAASRAVADLLEEASDSGRAERRPGPLLEKAILSVSGISFRGPYLRFSESADPAAYAALFARFLASGFLLPPDPALPAIVPRELSGGEETKLAEEIRGA